MLLCNNTAVPPVCVIIPASDARQAGRSVPRHPIIGAMDDNADDLAQHYLALWTQYLTALLADPRAMDTLKRWMSFTGQFAYPGAREAQGGAPPSAWPPFFGPFGLAPVPPGAGAKPEQEDAVAELARRVDELERRLARLEPRPIPRRPRRKATTRG
jgi:hypothetical protein